MRFANPTYLLVAAAAAAILVILFALVSKARQHALARIGATRLLPGLTASLSRRRRLVKQTAIVGGAVLLSVALARPQLGYRWEEAHRRGLDILFAIDTSKSMLTRDVKPDRLERAKLAVRSLVQKFPGDRVGLVAFAGNAFVETPLTLDHGIFDESVAGLDTQIIPLGGTNIASAIEQADKALSGDEHRKVLVLITDGENLAGNALDAAERAAKDGVTVYTLGVGTPNGELIPEHGPDGQTQFVRDENGALVTSRLDEALLSKIARATGGDFRPLGDSGQGLDSLYRDRLSKLPQSDLAARSVRVPLERYQWPLGLGLLLLGLEPLVSERRSPRAVRARSKSIVRTAAAAAGIGALLVAPSASASPQSALHAYQKGDFDSAEKLFEAAARSAPADARLSFDLGTAAYRKGDFQQAGKAFESSLRSSDLGLQQQAYYNLGNASYRLGEASLANKDIAATTATWKRAIGEYEGALRLRPDDADAQFNLEFVKKRLEDLQKKQQKQQEQQNQNQNQSSDQQKQSSGKSSQDQKQSGQDQKQSGQDQKQSGQDQKQSGQDQKQSGQDQKQSGQDQKQSGQDQKQSGQDQKQSGQDQKQGGQDQKQSGQDQKQGGQDQKQSGQDQKQSGQDQKQGASPAESGADNTAPGEMSKSDAEALLDSLRGELKVLSPVPAPPAPPTRQQEPRKDW